MVQSDAFSSLRSVLLISGRYATPFCKQLSLFRTYSWAQFLHRNVAYLSIILSAEFKELLLFCFDSLCIGFCVVRVNSMRGFLYDPPAVRQAMLAGEEGGDGYTIITF